MQYGGIFRLRRGMEGSISGSFYGMIVGSQAGVVKADAGDGAEVNAGAIGGAIQLMTRPRGVVESVSQNTVPVLKFGSVKRKSASVIPFQATKRRLFRRRTAQKQKLMRRVHEFQLLVDG